MKNCNYPGNNLQVLVRSFLSIKCSSAQVWKWCIPWAGGGEELPELLPAIGKIPELGIVRMNLFVGAAIENKWFGFDTATQVFYLGNI